MSKTTTKNLASCQSSCSMKGCKIALFTMQILFTSIYAYTIHRSHFGMQIPIDPKKPQGALLGPAKYLTMWDMYFQFLVSLLNVLVILTNCSKLTSLRNTVHHALSVPFGLSVACLFWSIFAVDRKLIFPKELEAIIPPFVNHVLHTLVAVTPLINEFLIYNERKFYHIFIYYTVYVLYSCQLLFFGYYLDFWIYPIFDHLNQSKRVLFLGFCLGFGSLIYLTSGALHNYLWSEKIKDARKKKA